MIKYIKTIGILALAGVFGLANPLGQAAMEFALRGNHDEQLKETSKETNLDWQRGFCLIHPFLNVIGVE